MGRILISTLCFVLSDRRVRRGAFLVWFLNTVDRGQWADDHQRVARRQAIIAAWSQIFAGSISEMGASQRLANPLKQIANPGDFVGVDGVTHAWIQPRRHVRAQAFQDCRTFAHSRRWNVGINIAAPQKHGRMRQ